MVIYDDGKIVIETPLDGVGVVIKPKGAEGFELLIFDNGPNALCIVPLPNVEVGVHDSSPKQFSPIYFFQKSAT